MKRAAGCGLLAAATLLLGACSRGEANAAFRPLAVGDVAPSYGVRTLANDSVHVGAGGSGDSLTLVNVWATWCESCREEFADLDTLARDFGPRGLRVVAVSVDQGDAGKVAEFARESGVRFAVAHDPAGRVQRLFPSIGLPSTYLIAPDGRLLWQQIGGLHGNPARARQALQEALSH